jgi:hypothetical protein
VFCSWFDKLTTSGELQHFTTSGELQHFTTSGELQHFTTSGELQHFTTSGEVQIAAGIAAPACWVSRFSACRSS